MRALSPNSWSVGRLCSRQSLTERTVISWYFAVWTASFECDAAYTADLFALVYIPMPSSDAMPAFKLVLSDQSKRGLLFILTFMFVVDA